MASRHLVPDGLRKSDFGLDSQEVAKQLVEPSEVEFARGKALDAFVATCMKLQHIRVKAAAGSGKSVHMPPALLKSGGRLLVHCVPSRHLAAALHAWVPAQHGLTSKLVLDVLDDYPDSGIVYTYSAAFVAQCMRWRSMGKDPEVTLYLDESHESDAATAVLRSLKTQIQGIARYLEASATFGTGDASTAFTAAKLVGTVVDNHEVLPDPDELDIKAAGKPWSMQKLQGTLMYIIDDDVKAQKLVDRYNAAGFYAARLSTHTAVEEFLGVMTILGKNAAMRKTVLVVDYTFRSGFTFPTLERIVDYCQVGFFTMQAGVTVREYREAYSAEIYQAKNRLGRVNSGTCVYVRALARPRNIQVLLEGVECDLAAIYRRALGFSADTEFGVNPYAKGNVPSSLASVIKGAECLRMYSSNSPWPNVDLRPRPVSPPAPKVLESPITSRFSELSVDSGRPPSVFSVDDQVGTATALTEGEFDELRRQSVAKHKPRPASPVPAMPMPPVAMTGDEWAGLMGGLRSKADVSGLPMVFKIGNFYEFRNNDLRTDRRTAFPDGPKGIGNAAAKIGIQAYMRHASHSLRAEAVSVALEELNRVSAKYNAAAAMVKYISGVGASMEIQDNDAYMAWLALLRDKYVGAESEFSACTHVLHAVPGVNFKLSSDGDQRFYALCQAHLLAWGQLLAVCVTGVPNVIEPGGRVSQYDEEIVAEEMMPAVSRYETLTQRCKVKLEGGGIKGKLVRMLVGGVVEVDLPAIRSA